MIYETQTIYENAQGQKILDGEFHVFETPVNMDNIVDASVEVEYIPDAELGAQSTLAVFGSPSLADSQGPRYFDNFLPVASIGWGEVAFEEGVTKRVGAAVPFPPCRLLKFKLMNNGSGQTVTIKSIKVMGRKTE